MRTKEQAKGRELRQQELEKVFYAEIKERKLGYLSLGNTPLKERKTLRTRDNQIWKIGYKLGLTNNEICYKAMIEKDLVCVKCEKNKNDLDHKNFSSLSNHFCKECLEQWEKEKYQRRSEQLKKEDDFNPIKRYAREIVRYEAPYEISYEQDQKWQQETFEIKQKERHEFLNNIDIAYADSKPDDITKEEWEKQQRKAKDFVREHRNQTLEDIDVKVRHAPINYLEHKLRLVNEFCQCTAAGLRQGIVCDICRLIKKVDEYMTTLFKDAAQGR